MKAVLFDVYHTLLLGSRPDDRETPLRRLVRDFDLDWPSQRSLAASLDEEIRSAHHLSRDPYPEVDIREIWRRILPGIRDPDAFALAAEHALHPVTLIRGAREAILAAHDSGLILGIVSNAQAYTPVLLERLLDGTWSCFHPELRVFSYEHRISKPDPRLFRVALDRLDRLGIAPADTLMIGDSWENDIAPAARLGLQVHHFTGWRHPLPFPAPASDGPARSAPPPSPR